jgi:cyclopropane fatty-acyl-phospholipid synthase-like methyltransferase
MEWLVEAMDLRPGMRVLDLGCGRALSAIFLAREFDLQVWATDLWIQPTDNLKRIEVAGVADRVFPISADAHKLPYARGFFDAVVSVDAYHYFGTEDSYLSAQLAPLLKANGQIGIVVPGLVRDFAAEAEREQFYTTAGWSGSELTIAHTAEWWRRHWQRSGCVDVRVADTLEAGWKLWHDSDLAWNGEGREPQMLRADAGKYLGLLRVVAQTKSVAREGGG